MFFVCWFCVLIFTLHFFYGIILMAVGTQFSIVVVVFHISAYMTLCLLNCCMLYGETLLSDQLIGSYLLTCYFYWQGTTSSTCGCDRITKELQLCILFIFLGVRCRRSFRDVQVLIVSRRFVRVSFVYDVTEISVVVILLYVCLSQSRCDLSFLRWKWSKLSHFTTTFVTKNRQSLLTIE